MGEKQEGIIRRRGCDRQMERRREDGAEGEGGKSSGGKESQSCAVTNEPFVNGTKSRVGHVIAGL